MPPIDKWLQLFESDKPAVKSRAAKAMLDLGEVPSALLLKMVALLPNAALHTPLRRALSDASDADLNTKIKSFLTAEQREIRQLACHVLGDRKATHSARDIAKLLVDPDREVRNAAGAAIARIGRNADIPARALPRYLSDENASTRPVSFDPFPDPASVFSTALELHTRYLLPLAAVDLSSISSQLSGIVHFIQPIEPYDGVLGENSTHFHTYLCRENYVGYQYDGNRCYLATDFSYFDLRRRQVAGDDVPEWLESHYRDVRDGFQTAQAKYRNEELSPSFQQLGGASGGGNWAESGDVPLFRGIATFDSGSKCQSDLPLTEDGRTFLFIGRLRSFDFIHSERDALGCDLLLFYDPESQVALTTFEWT